MGSPELARRPLMSFHPVRWWAISQLISSSRSARSLVLIGCVSQIAAPAVLSIRQLICAPLDADRHALWLVVDDGCNGCGRDAVVVVDLRGGQRVVVERELRE